MISNQTDDGLDPRAAERVAHVVHEVRLRQLAGREVDRDGQLVGVVAELALPAGELVHGPVHDQLPDLDDEPGVLGQLDEVDRRDDASLGVVPADERLEPGQPAGAQLDDGLEEQREVVALDGAVHLVAQVVEAHDRVARRRLEVLDPVPAPVLRLVHGRVGVAHEAVGRDPGAVRGRHADADGHEGLAVDQRHRLGHDLGQGVGQLVDASAAVAVREVDDELVAAEAGHGGVLAGGHPQSLADGLDHPVAGGVAERVVDHLEAVDVEEDDADGLAGRAADEGRRQALHERGAVEEAGQLVVVGRVREALGDGVLPGHVLHLADQVAAPVRLLDDRDAGVADDDGAVGVLVAEAVPPGRLGRGVGQQPEHLVVGGQLADRAELAQVAALDLVGGQAQHRAERGVDLDEVTARRRQQDPDGRLLEGDAEPLLGLPEQGLLAQPQREVAHRDDQAAHGRLLDVAARLGLHRRVRAVGLEDPEHDRVAGAPADGGVEAGAHVGEVVGMDELEDRTADELRRPPAEQVGDAGTDAAHRAVRAGDGDALGQLVEHQAEPALALGQGPQVGPEGLGQAGVLHEDRHVVAAGQDAGDDEGRHLEHGELAPHQLVEADEVGDEHRRVDDHRPHEWAHRPVAHGGGAGVQRGQREEQRGAQPRQQEHPLRDADRGPVVEAEQDVPDQEEQERQHHHEPRRRPALDQHQRADRQRPPGRSGRWRGPWPGWHGPRRAGGAGRWRPACSP